MSDVTDLAAAASAISDPATPAEDLAVIAGTHPSLRTAVVFHPNVYPALLDWLDALGDPNLSRAVAARRSTDAQQMPSPYPQASAIQQASPIPQESPYPQAYETAFASTNVVGGMDANATGMTVGTLTSGRPAPDSTVIAAPPTEEPMDEYAAPYTPRPQTGPAIAAGILFLAGAVLAGWRFVFGLFDFCGMSSGYSWGWYPWGWSSSFSYLCRGSGYSPFNYGYDGYSSTLFPDVFGIVAVAALIGCGVVSLVVGRKNLRAATLIVGIILTCVTAVSTVVAVMGVMDASLDFLRWGYPSILAWLDIVVYLVFFAVPVILMLVSRSSSERLMRLLKALLIIFMGLFFVGIWYFSDFRYGGGYYWSDNVLAVLFMNLGDIPLFAGMIALAFAVPSSSSQQVPVQRNSMLLAASAMAVAEGTLILLSVSISGLVDLFHYEPILGLILLVVGVYMLVAGILGIVNCANRSRSGLLIGLGIGFLVSQAIWFISDGYLGYWLSSIITIALFVAMAVLYIVGAANLRKNPAKRAAMQPVGQPYAGQPYAVQPYPGQPYNGVYDAPSGGYAVLGFFIPVVGLILYLVWRDQTPLRAKSAGKGALIGVIVDVVVPILIYVVFFFILYSTVNY